MNRREFLLAATAACAASYGCENADAAIDRVLRAIPVCVQITNGIITIVATTATSGTYESQIDTLAGEIIAAFTIIRELLREYRQDIEHDDIDKVPPPVLATLDSAMARIADNLTAILNVVRVFPPRVQRAVGSAVAVLETMLLGIAAIVPAGETNMFPRTEQALGARNRALGNIHAEIPSPRRLAQSYNNGVREDYPQARIHLERWYWLF